MNCLKCGTEITPPDVFCPDCQAEMEKYPVSRDATVFLPTHERRGPRKAYTPSNPEEQLASLRRRIRHQRTALCIFSILCAVLIVLLIFVGQALKRNYPIIGQNYQSNTTPRPIYFHRPGGHPSMMDIQALINQILVLFALILIGYAAQKAKLLPEETGKVISDLVINISNPCTILYSVFTSDRLLSNGQVLLFLGITTLVYIGTMLIAIPVPKILRVKSSQAGMYRYMTVFGNVGFLGIPVLRALMGADAVFLCSILNIVFNLSVYTYGQIQVAGDPSQRQITVKMFFTPIMMASYLSLILYLLNWKAPGGVLSVLSLLDRTTSPLAMLAIGCSMAAYSLRDIFLNWRVYVFSLVKLILVPVLTWAVLMPWLHSDLMLGVLVTCAAMPVATNATLMATKYNGDVKLAASGVFITTLFSLVALPALLSILF